MNTKCFNPPSHIALLFLLLSACSPTAAPPTEPSEPAAERQTAGLDVIPTTSPSPAPTNPTVVCYDTKSTQRSPWVLRINKAETSAEMIVHVPTDSIKNGVPPGNRRGRLVLSERTYEVVIPADSGGQGQQAWGRMQFAFEIDRFTKRGTLSIGEEKYGEVPKFDIRCEAGPESPPL